MFRFYSLFFLCFVFLYSTVSGQITSEVPSIKYRDYTLRLFYQGHFGEALDFLNSDLRSAVKIAGTGANSAPWLDSLCYWTMSGECHFQMARYDEAFKCYTTALQIYFDHYGWLKSVSASSLPGMLPRQPLPWGTSNRQGNLGNFHQCRFQMTHEYQRMVTLVNQPGLMNQKTITTIHADQIVTCLALTIRRRAEILGNLSKYDPDTKKLAEILANRPCLPNHFTGSWVDVLYGLTLSAMGDDAGAETQLNRGLLMLNTYDHHLTAVALNELGNIALRAGRPADACSLYLESSFAAYYILDPVLLGETFRNMANAHRLLQKTKPFPRIGEALTFLSTVRGVSPMTLLPLLHENAETAIGAGKYQDAAKFCGLSADVMKTVKGGLLFDTVHGARYHYLAATIDYINVYSNLVAGKRVSPQLLESGNNHLQSTLNFLRYGSLRLHQLNKLEEFFQRGMITSKGPITERIADELYDVLLRESTETDWILQPMDCFAAMTASPLRAYEHWFAVAYQRGNREKAFDISEKARQARFFAALPLGESRLTAFRLLFESDEESLPPEILLQRQTLSLEFKEFNKHSERVREIKKQLIPMSIVPQNPEQKVRQKALFAELEQQSTVQEAALRVMALSRTKAPQIFPPVLSLEQIRKELPEETAMLTFTESLGSLYGFLIDHRSLTVWQVMPQSPKDKPLYELITGFLQHLGNKAAAQSVSTKDLADPKGKWKEDGEKLLKRLLGNESRQANFSELVIVPAGPLWYVPFEAMSVQVGGQYRPLITAGQRPLVIRYAPTASLGVPHQTGRSLTAETLVLCGKLTPKDSYDVALNAASRFTKSGIKNLIPMKADEKEHSLPASASAFASQIQQLVVLDDIPSSELPLGWSPFNNDRTKRKNPAASWLSLPWGGPQLIVMPGFHTPAENSLKENKNKPTVLNGDDLFLSAMLLEACGAKTILISRWRTGGRVSYDLTEQFLLRYSTEPAADAWRQAIMEVGGNPLRPEEEPRVRVEGAGDPPIANHPFFWGAFMLIDRGENKK